MTRFRLTNWKWLVLGPLVAALVIAAACGGDEPEEPAGLTAEDVRSVVQEAVGDQVSAEDVRSVVQEAVGEQATAEDISMMVKEAVSGIDIPEGVSAEEVSSLVTSAVGEIDIPKGVSAEEIDAMVKRATEQAIAGAEAGVTAEELAAAIDKAVADAVADAVATILPVERIMEIAVTPVAQATAPEDALPFVKDAKYGGTPPFAITADPGFLDLHAGASYNSSFTVSIPRFNQLVEFNPDNYNQLIGELATGWDLSADGRTYTFDIHPTANWHDGEPVTAADVVFSLDRIADPDAIRPQAGAALRPFYERGTATALDPKTVEVPLYFPSAAFLPWLAFPLIAMYPKHVVDGLSQADANCCYENLVGSGPFMLKDFQRGSHIKWEKNPDYFRPGQPFLDGMDHFKILDPNRAILGMKTGQLMAFANFFQSGSTIDVFQQLEADTNGEVKTVEVKNAINRGLIINWTKPPLDNPNVRKAIMLALDRVEYVKTIWKGFGRQGTFIPGGSSVDHAEQNWPGWRYVDADGNLLTTDPVQVDGSMKHPEDVAEAQRLMEEAGAMGAQLDMLVFTIPAYQSIGQITAQQMKKYFDWDVTVRAVDLAAAMEESFAGRFDLYADGSLVPLADASTLLSQHYQAGGGRNPLNWFDERIDKLGAEAFRATTIEDRKAKYLEIEQIFVDEGHAQFIPVGWFPYVGGVNVKLRNFNMPIPGDVGYSPMIVAAQAEHWWIDNDATGFWPLGP